MQLIDAPANLNDGMEPLAEKLDQYVCVFLGDQAFGIHVSEVRDVLDVQRITPVPLAPPEIAGSLNLRGRIVTAINLRKRLGIKSRSSTDAMSIVIERDGELYSLLVDRVGEVLSVSSTLDLNPSTLNQRLRDVSFGVHRLDDALLIIFDVASLLKFGAEAVTE